MRTNSLLTRCEQRAVRYLAMRPLPFCLGCLGIKKLRLFGAQLLIVGNCFAELLECCLGGRGLLGLADGFGGWPAKRWVVACLALGAWHT